jgi:hypothetical protein
MKRLMLLFFVLVALISKAQQPEAKTYLKLYTQVSGTGGYRIENWYLSNNANRRIQVTLELGGTSTVSKGYKETKVVIVEPKKVLPLGLKSMNGSAPNTMVIVKAEYIP